MKLFSFPEVWVEIKAFYHQTPHLGERGQGKEACGKGKPLAKIKVATKSSGSFPLWKIGFCQGLTLRLSDGKVSIPVTVTLPS